MCVSMGKAVHGCPCVRACPWARVFVDAPVCVCGVPLALRLDACGCPSVRLRAGAACLAKWGAGFQPESGGRPLP